MLKNKGKVEWTRNKYTDQNYRPEDSVCKYSRLSSSKKSRTLYNPLCHADNRKHLLGLSLSLSNAKSKGSKRTCFTCRGKWGKSGNVLAKKKVTLSWLINSNVIKPEEFDHLHLFCHFTVLFKWKAINLIIMMSVLHKLFNTIFQITQKPHSPRT